MEKQPVSDRYCKHSTQVNITSHWTELVEMSMLDHVFDANFCCDAVVAKASSLFNTCIIPHNQYSTVHCTSCLQPVSIQLVLVSRFASKCVCVHARVCMCITAYHRLPRIWIFFIINSLISDYTMICVTLFYWQSWCQLPHAHKYINTYTSY